MQNTAQIFLDVNLKCNSCHDSFIPKWKLKDSYSLAAYFSTEATLLAFTVATSRSAKGMWAPDSSFPNSNRPPFILSSTRPSCTAAAIFTDLGNGRRRGPVVNRMWQRLDGAGHRGESWTRWTANRGVPELLDWLASDFVAEGYDLKGLIGTILQSCTYQIRLTAVLAAKGEPETQFTFRGPGDPALS